MVPWLIYMMLLQHRGVAGLSDLLVPSALSYKGMKMWILTFTSPPKPSQATSTGHSTLALVQCSCHFLPSSLAFVFFLQDLLHWQGKYSLIVLLWVGKSKYLSRWFGRMCCKLPSWIRFLTQCIVVISYGTNPQTKFGDSFALSWTTFTTVVSHSIIAILLDKNQIIP